MARVYFPNHIFKIIYISFLVCCTSILAQENPEKKLGTWYMYGGSHTLSENWKIKSLAHFRMFEPVSELQQSLLRFGANYKINKTLSVTAGYAYLDTDATYKQEGGTFGEHRIYEDFIIDHLVTKLKFNHRFRLEHRFFETETQHWIRYQLAASYPLNNKWSTYLFDEVFLNFQGDTFAQNWLGAGIAYKLSKEVKVKAGYMNIAQNNTNFNRLQIGIVIATDHQKK